MKQLGFGKLSIATVLKTINSVREYYGDMLKSSEGVKAAADAKVETAVK